MPLITNINDIQPGMTVEILINNPDGTEFLQGHRTRVTQGVNNGIIWVYTQRLSGNFYLRTDTYGTEWQAYSEELPQDQVPEYRSVLVDHLGRVHFRDDPNIVTPSTPIIDSNLKEFSNVLGDFLTSFKER